MQILKHILVFACVLGLVSGPVSAAGTSTSQIAQATQNATVSGTAFDNTGKPLGGVTMTLSGAGIRKTVVTDSTGKYSFTNVTPGLYALSATRAGYETAVQQDLAVAGADLGNLNVSLVPQSLQSLRTIGSVTTTAGRSTFNTSALSVTTLNNAQLVARVQPNLKDVVSELPGVIASRDSGGRSINSSFAVRGANLETKVTIDGHAVSSGVFGTYNNAYANSQIFEQVEVVKGPGISGVNAGESAFGTVNLRTRNFSPKNEWGAEISTDSYNSGHYQFFINHNFLNDKLTVLAARSYQGYNGPNQNVNGYVINSQNGTTSNGYQGPALIAWNNALADPYSTEADLLKARFKFSNATWLSGEFLNLTGRYFNQGGSYAYNYGSRTIPQCYNPTTKTYIYTLAGCQAGGASAVANMYSSPSLFGLVGSNQTLYGYFPNSYILNQEPQFSAELRTTFHNDTILLRPYRAEIKRYIDGSQEVLQPGYGNAAQGSSAPSGWFAITNPLDCQVPFVAANAKTGAEAKGPCFTGPNFTTPYVGPTGTDPQHPPLFQTTTTNPNCSAASPCYTSATNYERNGTYAYSTVFSQPEVDRLNGVTFSWVHPVGDNLYSLNYDYNTDNTLKFTADNSPLPAGCNEVVGASSGTNQPFLTNNPNPGSTPVPAGTKNPLYQPNCNQGGLVFDLPKTPIQIPPTTNYKYSLSLTGLIQVNPRLQVGIGNYFTRQRIDYQFSDPNAAATAANYYVINPNNGKATSLAGAQPSDSTYVKGTTTHSAYNPHIQAEYRLDRNTSLRLSGGSSTTFPYAGQISGAYQLSPNSSPGGTTDSVRLTNPDLQPETTVAYDLGGDFRLRDGAVISVDGFNNVVHNVWTSLTYAGNNLPGRTVPLTVYSKTINGPLAREYGVEATIQKAPPLGWGYYATGTLQRAYFDGFGNDFYQAVAAPYITANSKPGATCSAGGPPAPTQNYCIPYVGIVNGKQFDGTNSSSQIPFFKSKAEVNYAFKHAYVAFGGSLYGANNPWGGGAFTTFYANGHLDISRELQLGIAAENIFNYSVGNTGVFTGNVVPNLGFNPTGVAWAPGCSCLINGNVFGNSPNSLEVINPTNFYITLSKKI